MVPFRPPEKASPEYSFVNEPTKNGISGNLISTQSYRCKCSLFIWRDHRAQKFVKGVCRGWGNVGCITESDFNIENAGGGFPIIVDSQLKRVRHLRSRLAGLRIEATNFEKGPSAGNIRSLDASTMNDCAGHVEGLSDKGNELKGGNDRKPPSIFNELSIELRFSLALFDVGCRLCVAFWGGFYNERILLST